MIFFTAALAIQCVYVVFLLRGLRRAAENEAQADESRTPDALPPIALPPMSVVVAAHNEASTIAPLLDALARQRHPQVEVILVNDASTDDTEAILRTWANADDHRRVITMTGAGSPSKKGAVARGVSEASHDLIAFTDADCTPPPSWCEALARRHAEESAPVVIVGYSPFRQTSGLLNRWSRYETMLTGALTAAAAALGRPYMAVGRNLSTHRAVFETIHGQASGAELLSGDDDLFVQAVRQANAAPVVPSIDAATFVPTEAPSSWRSWIRQKRRHVSAGRAYDREAAFHLTVYHGSHIALWGAPLVLGPLGLGLLAMRLLVHSLVTSRAAEIFDEPDLTAFFPIGDALLALYHVLLVPLGLLRPPAKWRR